ncbi:hypothetical protein JCM3765_000917 [Sporobolomyces pararoseus]
MLSLRSIALLILAENVEGFGKTDEEKVVLNEIYHLYKTETVLGKQHVKLSKNVWVRYDSLTRDRIVWSPRPEEVLQNETTWSEPEYLDQTEWERDELIVKKKKRVCEKHHGVRLEKSWLKASDQAREDQDLQPILIKGIPFRCVTSIYDFKSTLLEPVPYWSGNVTILRRSTGVKPIKPTCHSHQVFMIHNPEHAVEGEGGEEATIHTLEYHHCRPKNFPGWNDEEYRKTLRELFKLVETCKQDNRRQIMIDQTVYTESSNPFRYFHQCNLDSILKEYNPSTLTTKIYEPFLAQEKNGKELEEWFEELHEIKKIEKSKRDQERGREHKRRKLEERSTGTGKEKRSGQSWLRRSLTTL